MYPKKQKATLMSGFIVVRIALVIPAEGVRSAKLCKHSKLCGGFATMHSHDTHSTHLLHTIAVVAQQLTQNL